MAIICHLWGTGIYHLVLGKFKTIKPMAAAFQLQFKTITPLHSLFNSFFFSFTQQHPSPQHFHLLRLQILVTIQSHQCAQNPQVLEQQVLAKKKKYDHHLTDVFIPLQSTFVLSNTQKISNINLNQQSSNIFLKAQMVLNITNIIVFPFF